MTTLKQLSEGLAIFAKYEKYRTRSDEVGADNGEIFFYVAQAILPPDSEDGKKLQELGFYPHEGHKPNNGKNWSIYAT